MFAGVAQSIPSFGDVAWHAPVIAATYGFLSANTLAPASGISFGQTLTANANGSLLAESAFLWPVGHPAVGDRVAVLHEASPKNGIYVVRVVGDATHAWVLVRATDADTPAELPTAWITMDLTADTFVVGAGGDPGAPNTWPFGHYVAGAGSGLISAAFQNGLAVVDGVNAVHGFEIRQVTNDRMQVDDGAGGPVGLDMIGDMTITGAIAGILPVVHVYTASTTWAKPANVQWITVECVGGGGGGGGCDLTGAGQAAVGGAGGGGGYAKRTYAGSALSGNYTVTVGAGGGGGAAGNNNGTDGGTSSFAGAGITTLTANGGVHGNGAAASATGLAAGGAGGTAANGDINIQGGDGTHARWITALPLYADLAGGTVLGTARHGTAAGGGGAGLGGHQYGGGGTGGLNAASQAVGQAGGSGITGVVIVTEYYGP